MEPRHELIAAIRGEKTARVPFFLREGYEYWRDPTGKDEFRVGWMNTPEWHTIMEASRECNPIRLCQLPVPVFNRFMMTTPGRISVEERQVNPDLKEFIGRIDLKGRTLTFRDTEIRGMDMQWYDQVPVNDLADIEVLMSMPFELDEAHYDQCVNNIFKINDEVISKDAVYQLMFPDPVVAISRCMHFDMFLEMTIMENELLHEALSEISKRMVKIADYIAPKLPKDIVIWAGGSEQCTPPMMAPTAYDEFVLPYTKPVVDKFKENGFTVVCHSHGKVKHALDIICQMGFDATEPVEPEPQGDVSLKEGFEITKGRLTLMGNMEWVELAEGTEEQVRERVRVMAESKNERLVITASAGPTSPVDEKTVRNHLVWFDEYCRLF